MTLPLLLFILRLAGGALLLLFVGLIGWYLAQDLRAARLREEAGEVLAGALVVLESQIEGLSAGSRFDLLPVTLIGRGSRCTVLLDEPYVSAEHASLSSRDKRWWLEDLGSRNGTLLNDIDVREPTVVTNDDSITIGSTRFRVELGRK